MTSNAAKMKPRTRRLLRLMTILSIIFIMFFMPEAIARVRFPVCSAEDLDRMLENHEVSAVWRYQNPKFATIRTSDKEMFCVSGEEQIEKLSVMSYVTSEVGEANFDRNISPLPLAVCLIIIIYFATNDWVGSEYQMCFKIHGREQSKNFVRATAAQTSAPPRQTAPKQAPQLRAQLQQQPKQQTRPAAQKQAAASQNIKKDGRVVTFNDIAGYETTKKSMQFIVDCLKDSRMLMQAGAKIPKGVILYGPPGTGKTLMAAAIAGSAGVPFFSINASAFIDTYVGTGPAAVRALYEKARAAAPCVVFIDEVDAVGRKRQGGSNQEYVNTTNALLSELDGIGSASGVMTIAATNDLDALDSAFVRPGRFDRKIMIPLPDVRDREAILRLHCKNKRLTPDVDLASVAKNTEGMSAAELATLMNESAILAVRDGRTVICRADIDTALFQMTTGGEEKRAATGKTAEIIAWHEAGHAVCIKLLTNRNVPKVTIRASTTGMAGATLNADSDSTFSTKKSMENLIKCLYAGRAAEELYLGNGDDITSAASGDIADATELIREYLTKYGMGKNGLINMNVLTGHSMDGSSIMEAQGLANRLYEETRDFLSKNKQLLGAVANELLRKETINERELDAIIIKFPVNHD